MTYECPSTVIVFCWEFTSVVVKPIGFTTRLLLRYFTRTLLVVPIPTLIFGLTSKLMASPLSRLCDVDTDTTALILSLVAVILSSIVSIT